jgi:aryl-phospho-beta-D-glucosidase BglC (GH1 family)
MKACFALLFLAIFAVAAKPVSVYGEFKADGSSFRGSKNSKLLQVKGVSFFWSQWAGSFYNENAVNHMVQDWKAEVVRAAYGTTGSAFSSSAAAENRAYIETIIEAAVKNDIYVIIDWHSHNAHLDAETERAKQFFSYFAENYGHLDNVIFELYNEPIGATWAQIKGYAEKVIPEIRKHSDNLILVGTRTYSQKIEEVIGNAIEDENVGYVLHFYAASHLLSNFRSSILSVENARLPIFVTEFGTTNADGGNPEACDAQGNNCKNHYDTHNAANTSDWLNFLDNRMISYCAWSLFDKYEGSAFFGISGSNSFDQTKPENWTNTSLMTASGKYIFDMLNNGVPSPILKNSKFPSIAGLRIAGGKIYINLDKSGDTSIDIYSISGTKVESLINGHQNAGSYEFNIGSLRKGVYIIRLKQGNEVKAAKISL